jgi:RNA polymerase sigma factor (sigma-70 family)
MQKSDGHCVEDVLEAYLPYLRGIASRACAFNRDFYLDFCQCGVIGIIDACTHYDADLGDFDPYVRRKIKTAISDAYRKQKLSASGQKEILVSDHVSLYEKRDQETISVSMDNAISLIEFYDIINKVDRFERMILYLHCVEDMSLREIALLYGLSINHRIIKIKRTVGKILKGR